MKKITLLFLSIFALIKMSNAQTAIDPMEFFNNPSKFNGRIVTMKDIIVHRGYKAGNDITPASTQITPGSGTSTPPNSNTTAIRCNAPRGYEMLEIVFPNGQTKGCFIILTKIANPVPSNKDVTATITFKADNRAMNKISMIKFIP